VLDWVRSSALPASAPTPMLYLGGDVDQDWAANVGVKYTGKIISLLKKKIFNQNTMPVKDLTGIIAGMYQCYR
jgi:hypothetical protein